MPKTRLHIERSARLPTEAWREGGSTDDLSLLQPSHKASTFAPTFAKASAGKKATADKSADRRHAKTFRCAQRSLGVGG